MKNLFRLTLITLLCFGVLSCTDLDEEIEGDFTENFDPANPGVGIKNNVNKATPNDGLTAAFARVLNGTANHDGYWTIQELSSDEAVITQKGGDWFDGGVLIDMHQHKFSEVSFRLNDAWVHAYGGIFQCNDLLNGTLTAPQTAQIRTLRAFFYWRLLDLFGRVKIAVTPGVEAPQSTRLEVYTFIETELLEAIPDLPAGKQEYGRLNKTGAYALLARLYLNAKVYKDLPDHDPADLQKAIDAADEVINSGIYSLSPDYADVFAPDNVENIEHIFVAPFDEATGQGMNFAQMTLHYPSQLTYKLAEQPWNGYSTIEEFYNSYEASDERKTNNFIVGPQFDLTGNPILDLAFDKEDDDGPAINYTPAINELFPNGSRQAGARLGKFSFKIGQVSQMDNDFPLLRYGEVLLNKAEALARLNNDFNDAIALSLVNQLRNRAGAAPFGSMTEGSLLAERGRELFMEALRRTDLIRFGAFHNAWWEKPAHADDHRKLFPIPLEQINATANQGANKLTQNPGY